MSKFDNFASLVGLIFYSLIIFTISALLSYNVGMEDGYKLGITNAVTVCVDSIMEFNSTVQDPYVIPVPEKNAESSGVWI